MNADTTYLQNYCHYCRRPALGPNVRGGGAAPTYPVICMLTLPPDSYISTGPGFANLFRNTGLSNDKAAMNNNTALMGCVIKII